jgi:serine/threonine-protein kinase
MDVKLVQIAAAERGLRDCIALQLKINGPRHPETLWEQTRLAVFLQSTARAAEAKRLLAQIQDAIQGKGGKDIVPMSIFTWADFARIELSRGDMPAAGQQLQRYLPELRSQYANSRSLAGGLLLEAEWLTDAGRFEEADADLAQALQVLRQSGGKLAQPTAENGCWLMRARLALARQQPGEALKALGQVRTPAQALPLALDELTASTLGALAKLEQGQASEAASDAQSVLEALKNSGLRDYFKALEAEALMTLSQAVLHEGDAGQARLNAEDALALRQATQQPASPFIAEAQLLLAQALIAEGRADRARPLMAEATSHLAAPVAPQFQATLKAAQAALSGKSKPRAHRR